MPKKNSGLSVVSKTTYKPPSPAVNLPNFGFLDIFCGSAPPQKTQVLVIASEAFHTLHPFCENRAKRGSHKMDLSSATLQLLWTCCYSTSGSAAIASNPTEPNSASQF
jgi:hypothetical protein